MKLFNFNAILLALLLTSILSFSQSNSINQTLFGHQLTDANIKFIDTSHNKIKKSNHISVKCLVFVHDWGQALTTQIYKIFIKSKL